RNSWKTSHFRKPELSRKPLSWCHSSIRPKRATPGSSRPRKPRCPEPRGLSFQATSWSHRSLVRYERAVIGADAAFASQSVESNFGVLVRPAALRFYPLRDGAVGPRIRPDRPGEEERMTALTELLRQHPEIALFAALSLGFFLGKRKVGNFSLGTSAG